MKKLVVLLIAVMVLACMGLVACGGDETTETTVAPTDATTAATDTTEAAATTVDWTEAAAHVGETATVEGPVVSVDVLAFADNKVLVHVGAADDTGFAAAIEGFDADKFTGLDDTLVGKTVQVTGEIYINEFDGNSEVLVSDPANLVVVE